MIVDQQFDTGRVANGLDFNRFCFGGVTGVGDGIVAGFGQRQFAGSQFFFAQTLLGQKTAHGADHRQHFSQIAREGKPQRDATARSARRFGHAAYFLTISKTRCRRVNSRICCTGGVGFNNRTAPLRVQAVL